MSLKSQLKILQDRKQYAAMIALLEASDEPNRTTIIARIQLKMQEAERAEVEVKATTEPVQELPKLRTPPVRRADSGQSQRTTRLILFTIVTIIVVPLVGHVINSYINRYQWRMEDVCRDVYRDDWVDDTITFNQWYYGCQAAAAQSIDFFGEEIAYCYANHNGTDRRFQECLAEENVRIYSSTVRETAP